MKSGRRKLEAYNRTNGTEIRITREKTKKVQDQESLSLYIRRQLKESLSKSGSKTEVSIVRGMLKIGTDQPIKPSVAAVKLNIDMSNWKGPSLEEMLSDKERNDIETGQLVYGSMNLISNKPNTKDKVTKDNHTEKSALSVTPKRKRTRSDFLSTQ
ncbi:unnamed protein product [Nippostrongylus brasiliensis]|uniref:M-phase phosphoprotein 6 n=1 Tax=Nippostrongylus brasiliensis TaxID=27835 RepID=A0A0N4YKC5_NIPBR|nr:unnamed protein product [Nippostrongylus brasiliensis]